VPAGVWQGSRVRGGDYALLGTTVAPGFEFSDFQAGNRSELIEQYESHADWIHSLPRN
jgi:predicted cupin superfamily sugar epimerase